MLLIKSIVRQVLIFVMMFAAISVVEAKTIYINDQLRVGIRSEPNNDSAPLAVVSTGDKLEMLEKNDGYVLVKTEQGVEGWIKDIYTTEEAPAIVRLKELSQTSGGTDIKLKELTKQVGLMQSANEVLNQELEQTREEKNKIQVQLLALKSGQVSEAGWLYWLSAMLVFTVASFISGMFWYRKQAMKRLGGLRIYF